jgi:hypothetical protein
VTSHRSQGLTAERVLVNMDTQVHPELIKTSAVDFGQVPGAVTTAIGLGLTL